MLCCYAGAYMSCSEQEGNEVDVLNVDAASVVPGEGSPAALGPRDERLETVSQQDEMMDFQTTPPESPGVHKEDVEEYRESVLQVTPALEFRNYREEMRQAPAKEGDAEVFDCTVEKVSGRLGLKLERMSAGILVVGLSASGGGVHSYNLAAEDGRKIMVHDIIRSVNGETAFEKVVTRIQEDSKLTLQVLRPAWRSIVLNKTDGPLDLQLSYRDSIGCLEIAEVSRVAVRDCITGASLDTRVKRADLIESVNGVFGHGSAMLREIKTSTRLEMRVLRMPEASLAGVVD